jgi:urea transport system substrate-binding protein
MERTMTIRLTRRGLLRGAGATALGLSAASFPAPGLIRSARAADTVKLGCLFSSSGAMANVEGRLTTVVKMAAEELNAKGGVLGKTVEVIGTDPASDWPLYAQLARQLITQDQVAALFGCWTSVSRKSVLPVVEQEDALLYYPLHFEGEENSKNVVYLNSPPSSSVLPAVEYLMGPDGGEAKRFFMLGSDYVWPRTINQQLKGYWASKGITPDAWREEYVPVGHSNFQTLVNQIREFADQPGGQPVVILTVVGNSIPDFFREFANQGISALDVPVLGLDALEADFEGLDTSALVGHLNCWAYLQTAPGPRNQEFLAAWSKFVTDTGAPYRPDVSIDPMVSAYDGVHLWALAAEKAGSFDVPEVRAASPSVSFSCPSGYEISMMPDNTYIKRGVFIGSLNENQLFDVLWQSEGTPDPVPFSPFMNA